MRGSGRQERTGVKRGEEVKGNEGGEDVGSEKEGERGRIGGYKKYE